jgi:chorismate mutase
MNTHFQKIFNHNKPVIIAGPCSAESEKQVLATAHELKKHPNLIFRAGIWKPRTRPNSFEGVGVKGLKWLQKAKEETGLQTTTEVAKANHVELAIKHQIDILWIGARTTGNPFAVQEIAEALKGIDVPVFVKNPINPELNLWIGAIERLKDIGIHDIAAIHRGFFAYKNSKYRNTPQWQIAIDIQKKFPNLPMICDPSHITGKRNMIFEVAQKAMDMNYDGLMIETHKDPENALSDSEQQITPKDLETILNKLVIRNHKIEDKDFKSSLEQLRFQIDDLDIELLDTLKRRMELVQKIGSHKKENKVTILQNDRWSEMLKTRSKYGKENGLSEQFVQQLLKAIHQESIDKQNNVMNNNDEI